MNTKEEPQSHGLSVFVETARVVLLTTAAVMALSPLVADAAVDATLSSDHARPRDHLLLLTDNHGGAWDYSALILQGPHDVFMAPTTSDPGVDCGGPDSIAIGQLVWRGSKGGVAFDAPLVTSGDYWFFLLTDHECWRIGTPDRKASRIMTLRIGTDSAIHQDLAASWARRPNSQVPRQAYPAPVPILLFAIATIGLVGAGTLLAKRRRLQR